MARPSLKQVGSGILSLFLLMSARSLKADGLSTPFVDVFIDDVPLGVAFKVQTNTLPHLVLNNLGDQPIQVQVQSLESGPSELKEGAQPIPSADWIEFEPNLVFLYPHKSGSCDVILRVPNERRYRHRLYQVTIWSHSVPFKQQGMFLGTGLKSRLRFRTARR